MSNNYVYWTGTIQSGHKAPEFWNLLTFSEHAQFTIFNIIEGKVGAMQRPALVKKIVDICRDYKQY